MISEKEFLTEHPSSKEKIFSGIISKTRTLGDYEEECMNLQDIHETHIDKVKHKQIMEKREHTHQINLECAREGTKEATLDGVKEIIDKILPCSLNDLPKGQQCNDKDCLNCCKNKELKKELGIKDG